MNDIEKIIKIIKGSKKTVFFGGAGVSTESRIKDFRSKDGLYSEQYAFPPEEILSHHFFYTNPKYFYKFYREKLNPTGYKPNVVHKTLALMEEKGLLSSIITQNIDGLHEMAHSKNVLNLHGTVYSNTCTKCHKKYDLKYVLESKEIPLCSCGGIIKPDVVLYEEPLDYETLDKAINEIKSADTLIMGGTSLLVYPAASLINYFNGKHIILINKEETKSDYKADIVIHDKLGNVFKKIKDAITSL